MFLDVDIVWRTSSMARFPDMWGIPRHHQFLGLSRKSTIHQWGYKPTYIAFGGPRYPTVLPRLPRFSDVTGTSQQLHHAHAEPPCPVRHCTLHVVMPALYDEGFPKMVIPHSWLGFVRENPIKIDDLGIALFQETPI